MKDLNIKKLYYSISEVSKMTSLKPYVLRYWESEFSELKPSKNRAGNRIYRSNDIKIVLLIKKLLYVDKYTIAGAKQKLSNLTTHRSQQLDFTFPDRKFETFMNEMKNDLHDSISLLDKK